MSPKSTTATTSSWIGAAFVIGGLLWIAHYAIWIAVGLLTGEVPVWGTASEETAVGPTGYLDLTSFCSAILCFAAGLYGVGAMLKGSSRILRVIGLFFTALAGLMAAGGLIGQLIGQLLGFAVVSGMLMGNGVMAVLLGATFLSIAAFRGRTLPRQTALLLLANGLLTFPLIVSIVSILPNLPAYVVDELPFAVSGVAWMVVGLAFLSGREEVIPKPEPAVR